MPWEAETIARPGLQLAGADNLAENREEVLKWFGLPAPARSIGYRLDLDVQDLTSMCSTLYANPQYQHW
jgi:hypothetical protein